MEENLQGRPFLGAEKTPGAGGKNEGVPGCNSEGADEEILLGGKMSRKVEVVWEDLGKVGGRRVGRVVGHGGGLPESRATKRGAEGGRGGDEREMGGGETGRAWEEKVAVWRAKDTRCWR